MKATMITIITMRNFASGCYLTDPTDAYQILISQRGEKNEKGAGTIKRKGGER